MALNLGWKVNDVRESIWMKDPALRDPLPDGVLDMWREDGAAEHLEPYAVNGKPTIIEWRPLNSDEKQVVLAPWNEAENQVVGVNRVWLRCFRIAVRFRDTEEKAVTSDGNKHRVVSKDASGVPMLAMGLVDDITDRYPGMIQFYGNLIYNSSFLGDVEKKASSPPSTPTPSSGVASTADTTAPSPPAEAATGAP